MSTIGPEAESELSPGESFEGQVVGGKYLVGPLLGSGGMGTVGWPSAMESCRYPVVRLKASTRAAGASSPAQPAAAPRRAMATALARARRILLEDTLLGRPLVTEQAGRAEDVSGGEGLALPRHHLSAHGGEGGQPVGAERKRAVVHDRLHVVGPEIPPVHAQLLVGVEVVGAVVLDGEAAEVSNNTQCYELLMLGASGDWLAHCLICSPGLIVTR